LRVISPLIHNLSRPQSEIRVKIVIVILVLAIWLFRRRSQKKNKKGLGVKARGIDDASSDHESIVPLVLGETKEKNGDYSYKGANYSVGEARPY